MLAGLLIGISLVEGDFPKAALFASSELARHFSHEYQKSLQKEAFDRGPENLVVPVEALGLTNSEMLKWGCIFANLFSACVSTGYTWFQNQGWTLSSKICAGLTTSAVLTICCPKVDLQKKINAVEACSSTCIIISICAAISRLLVVKN